MSRSDIAVAATEAGAAPAGAARVYARLLVPALGLLGFLLAIPRDRRLAIFALAAALLAAAHLLPRVRRGSLAKGALLFLAGFAGSLAAVNLALDKAGFVRDILPNQQTAYVARQGGDKPVLLLMGSSFTQYGIDEAVFEAELAKAGRPMRVVKLGYGGMSSIERYYYLRKLLERSAVKPEAVLFEVSYYYEIAPLLQLQQNLYSDRMVEMMDLTSARLALDWIRRTSSLPFNQSVTLGERLALAGHVLAHAALHYAGFGFLPAMARPDALVPNAVSGEIRKTATMSDAEVAKLVDAAYDHLNAPHDPAEIGLPNAWSEGLSAEMIDRLAQSAGTARFGFYHLPTTEGYEFLYAKLFCRDERRFACISPTDAALHAELRQQSYWLDHYHLHGPGRERITRWLAGRILPSLAAR